MKVLLDTHVLLWAAFSPEHLSKNALKILRDEQNELWFITLLTSDPIVSKYPGPVRLIQVGCLRRST